MSAWALILLGGHLVFAEPPAPDLAEERAPQPPREPPATCTYDTWTWSVTLRRSVERRRVQKPYAELRAEDKAPDWATTGCTLCNEDQQEVAVPGAPSVRVCHAYAERVRQALERAVSAGFRVETLVGYRVGRSVGPVVGGKRTRYGWHAYGEALDVNSGANGMYTTCARDKRAPVTAADLTACRRTLGGAWNPAERPRTSLTADGPLVRAFADVLAWGWGGERADGTKDLMHVSPDGY